LPPGTLYRPTQPFFNASSVEGKTSTLLVSKQLELDWGLFVVWF
jgi:hypothetical protein